MIRRREFIAGLGGAAAWPLATRAQQRASPVVCYVSAGGDTPEAWERAFRQGLGEAGYSEGRNVTVEYHFLDGKFDRQDPSFPWHFQGVGENPHSCPPSRAEPLGKGSRDGGTWDPPAPF
jgi:hypothetical protein